MNNKPECIINEYGTKIWRLNGELHREDGPAVEYDDGSKFWYLNNILHREDGPAIEYPDGEKRWFLNSEKFYSEAEFYKKLYKMGNISEEDYFLGVL
jgi:hypothetical protein